MLNRILLIVLSFFVLLIVPLTGCREGLKTNETEFTVTLDGKPLEGAGINLIPKDEKGVRAFGMTDAAGKCQVQTLLGNSGGTTVGEYIVTVSKKITKPTGEKIKGPNDVMIDVTDSEEILPSHYNDSNKTPFTVTVKPGKNSFSLALESPK
ncbi:MAG: DUF4198 domain-containing protein [Planctomycetaceae bacterium]|jgi:hypothetical protein|nr:DUF4198 domain-containing protein [Planctomycetaceae bacterium]